MAPNQRDGQGRDGLRIVTNDNDLPQTPTATRPSTSSQNTACGLSPESRGTSSEVTIRNTVFVIEKPRASCASTTAGSRSSFSPLSRSPISPLSRSPHSPPSPRQTLINHEQLFDDALREGDSRCWLLQRKRVQVAYLAVLGMLASVTVTLVVVTTFLKAVNENVMADLQLLSPTALSTLLPTALFVLGLGLGPLILAPLSENESVGRRLVYIESHALFAVLNVACGFATGTTVLPVLRLLAGMAGSAGSTLGPASVGDMFSDRRGRNSSDTNRDTAQAVHAFGVIFGMVVGSIVSGFIHGRNDSRQCILWITAVLPAAAVLLAYFFLQETYRPVLMARARAERHRRHEERWAWLFDRLKPSNGRAVRVPNTGLFWEIGDIDIVPSSRLARARRACCSVLHQATRPLRTLARSPLLLLLSLCKALACGVLYLHALSLVLLCRPHGSNSTDSSGPFAYNWPNGGAGPALFAIGASALGVAIIIILSHGLHIWMRAPCCALRTQAASREGELRTTEEARYTLSRRERPGDRVVNHTTSDPTSPKSGLLVLQASTPLLPLGLLLFALSAARTHWALPLAGTALFAVGTAVSHVGLHTYVVHVFSDRTAVNRQNVAWPIRLPGFDGDSGDGGNGVENDSDFAASALAAAGVVPAVVACLLTVFGLGFVLRLGYLWANIALALVAAALVPLPFAVWAYRVRLRARRLALRRLS